MSEKINAILMLEILGKPAEHIKKILSQIIDKLAEEKDVRLIEKKIADPKEIPEQKELFSSFAEVEIETNLEKLLAICFGYMPSHIEIISPEYLKFKNYELNISLNVLIRRLHQSDELAKGMMIERHILAEQIKQGKIKIVDNKSGINPDKAETSKKRKKK